MGTLPDAIARLRELAFESGAGPEAAAARRELAELLLAAQQAAMPPEHRMRRHMRVAWALESELRYPSGGIRCITNDISVGGFSVLLGELPPTDARVEFALRLPGAEGLQGEARVASLVSKAGHYRVSFEFLAVAGDGRDRLERFVFEAVLRQLFPGGGTPRAR